MPRLKRPDTAMPSSVPLLEAALVLVGFLTATLSGVAGMGVRELTFELERTILEDRARERAEESGEVDEGYRP